MTTSAERAHSAISAAIVNHALKKKSGGWGKNITERLTTYLQVKLLNKTRSTGRF